MSDRRVVYKTPLHRISETALVLLVTIGLAVLWHGLWPSVTPSYMIVLSFIAGSATVSTLGSRVALRRGAATMTRQERTQRYLSELGPIGARHRASGLPSFGPAAARRSSGRSLRRG
jgi:hypothetical protein